MQSMLPWCALQRNRAEHKFWKDCNGYQYPHKHMWDACSIYMHAHFWHSCYLALREQLRAPGNSAHR